MKKELEKIKNEARENLHSVYYSGMPEKDLLDLVEVMVENAFKDGQLFELRKLNLDD